MNNKCKVCDNYNDIIPYLSEVDRSPRWLSLQLNLTNICFCKCQSCRKYQWPQISIDYEILRKTIYQAVDMGCETFVLSGGEPLAYKKIDKVMDDFLMRGCKFGINTSAIIPEENKSKIPALSENASWIDLSLDASTRELFAEIRGVDAFDMVISNINEMQRYRGEKQKVRINTTVSKMNVRDVTNIFVLAKELDCEVYFYQVHTWPELMLDAHDREILEDQRGKLASGIHDRKGTNLFDMELVKIPLPKLCCIPRVHAIIDADGYIYPCCNTLNDNGEYNEKRENSYGNIYDTDMTALYETAKALVYPRPGLCDGCDRYRMINRTYTDYIENRRPIFI